MIRRIRRALAAMLLLTLCWLCWNGYAIWSFGTQDSAKPSDCAVVLGAAVYGPNPSPVFEQRILHAIQLHRRGLVTKSVFTGGRGAGSTHAESEVAARYTLRMGVPQHDILTEIRSRTTQQN